MLLPSLCFKEPGCFCFCALVSPRPPRKASNPGKDSQGASGPVGEKERPASSWTASWIQPWECPAAELLQWAQPRVAKLWAQKRESCHFVLGLFCYTAISNQKCSPGSLHFCIICSKPSQREGYNYRQTLFYWASLFWASQMSHFLQTDDKTLHQQRDYSLLYCNSLFTVVVWSQTHSISKACL